MCFNSHLFLQYYVQFPLVDSSIPLIIPSYLDPPTIQIPWNPHQKSPSTTMKNPHQLTINPPDLTFIGCAFLREWLCGLQHIFHCEIWGICNIQLGSFLGYHMVIIYLGVSKERGTPFHHPYFRLAFSLTKTIRLLGIPMTMETLIYHQVGCTALAPTMFNPTSTTLKRTKASLSLLRASKADNTCATT